MRKRVLKSLWGLGAAVGLGLLASPAMASIDVTIDPEGDAAGAVLVSSLDWNVGNSLSQDGITAIQTLGTTDTYFQARLSVFNLAGGGTAQPATGEWTIVGGVTEQVVGVVGTTALFARAANPTVNFIEIWYDATPNADDLAGTGFNDGTLILSAEVNTLASNFTIFGGPTTLDGFQDDDWAGQQSVQGVGATSLTATVLSVDTAFFTDLMRDNAIELTLFNASQICLTAKSILRSSSWAMPLCWVM